MPSPSSQLKTVCMFFNEGFGFFGEKNVTALTNFLGRMVQPKMNTLVLLDLAATLFTGNSTEIL